MSNRTFRALMLNQVERQTHAEFKELSTDDLPDGEVLVKVAYSSLNYKDGLAVTGKGKIVHRFPMVPGIDFAGTVEESASPEFEPGQQVVLTGAGVGENHWGGYAQMARVKSDWLVALPEELTLQQAMAIGTAGFTAMMSVMALEAHGCTPESGEVVVSGASGGVGSTAIAILAHLGYQVVASTGRTYLDEYLKSLGAKEIMARHELARSSKRPLESGRWAGAVDNVGGETLATILRTMKRGGSVAVCGLAGGHELNTTVFPFILRGVNLLGIDSVGCSKEQRLQIWSRLVKDLPPHTYEQVTQIEPLSNIFALSEEILKGQIRGRVVVDVNA